MPNYYYDAKRKGAVMMKPSTLIENSIHYVSDLISSEAISYQARRDAMFQEKDRLEKVLKDLMRLEDADA